MEEKTTEKHKGVVKWFDEKKGFGFIINDADSKEYFFHYSSIASKNEFKTITEGRKASFEIEESERGLKAKNVEEIKE